MRPRYERSHEGGRSAFPRDKGFDRSVLSAPVDHGMAIRTNDDEFVEAG